MRLSRLFLLGLVLAAPAAAQPAAQTNGDLIVFASNRSPLLLDRIYTASPERAGTLRALAVGTDAAYAPDRRRIAFLRGSGLNANGTEVALMNADGSGVRTIYRQPAGAPQIPAWAPLEWSPDGTRIAFLEYGPTIDVLDVRTGLVAQIPRAIGPSWSPDGRRLAFEDVAPYPLQLGIAAPDGRGRRAIAPADATVGAPVWSPRGDWLVYGAAYANGTADLYRIHSDGTGLRRLTHDAALEQVPSWSPGGTRIAFVRIVQSPRTPERYTLRTIGVDGRGARDLAPVAGRGRTARPPAWTRDGRRIAVATSSGIEVVDARRGGARNVRTVAAASAFTSGPQWSLDGQRLLFSAHLAHKDYDLYLMRPDGTGLRRLTRDPADERAPAWSPDGTRIAFGHMGARGGIFVNPASGGSTRRITHGADSSPTWSPDGKRIAFVRGFSIWTIGADGRDPRALATVKVPPRRLSWSPDGSTIAFADGAVQLLSVATGDVRPLPDGGEGFKPGWSRDGRRVIFTSYRNARSFRDPQAWGLFSAPTTGGTATRLLTGYFFWASFGPDGLHAAAEGSGSIWLLSTDGTSEPTRLVGRPGAPTNGYDREPDWQP